MRTSSFDINSKSKPRAEKMQESSIIILSSGKMLVAKCYPSPYDSNLQTFYRVGRIQSIILDTWMDPLIELLFLIRPQP